MAEVNRTIRDNPALDDVDHALGRPLDPFGGYRNHYVPGCPEKIAAMRASPWWQEEGQRGDMTWFSVTDEGRRALAEELKMPTYGRSYVVTYVCGTQVSVNAKSRSQARYNLYLQLDADFSFQRFLREVKSVRLA